MDEFNPVTVFKQERSEILSVNVSTVHLDDDGRIILLAEIKQLLNRQVRKVEPLEEPVKVYIHSAAAIVVGTERLVPCSNRFPLVMVQ